MNERGWIEPIVERVVAEVLDSRVAQLRNEIVRRVTEEIAAAAKLNSITSTSSEPAHSHSPVQNTVSTADLGGLARAVAEIQSGTSQREILRALLDTSSRYASRVALFVVKSSRATGWQARGFADCDAVKDFILEESTPAVVCAIRDRALTSATADDLDSRFLDQVGTPASGEVQILPLILKDKVAALLYADSGIAETGPLDIGSLELLVLSTSAWLEVNSLRKTAQKESPAAAEENAAAAETSYQSPMQKTPVQPAPAFNDPFASHAPASSTSRAMAATASAGLAPAASEEVQAPAPTAWGVIAEVRSAAVSGIGSAVVEAPPPQAEPSPVEPTAEEPAPLIPDSGGPASLEQATSESAQEIAPPAPAMSPEEQEVHRKAQRFARLLVDEIKLYNQAKVAEGRKSKDLYDRLSEVIEKSRVTYQKRYGTTVAASGNYFIHEIIRSLAEDDISIMGANFRH